MSVNVAAPGSIDANLRLKPYFSHRHVVSFEETNVVGNVYFAHHISWQGRCREMFLKRHAPTIVDEIKLDLRLVTLRVSCEYFEELNAFDEVEIRMLLSYIRQHRIGLDFVFLREGPENSQVARGFQEIGCMRVTRSGLTQIAPPSILADALRSFAPVSELRCQSINSG